MLLLINVVALAWLCDQGHRDLQGNVMEWKNFD